MMTANCIKVTNRDNTASNGVIHVVEKTLKPVSKTLMDLISGDPEMSYLKTGIGIKMFLSCFCFYRKLESPNRVNC